MYMIPGILAFLAGVLLLQQLSMLPSLYWCGFFFLLALIPFIPSRYRVVNIVILFVAGFLWATLRAHMILDISLAEELQGKDVLVTGVISSIPITEERKTDFEFDIETLEYKNKIQRSPGKVHLSWYSKRTSNTIQFHPDTLKAGQRWQFWLRLKQPHGFMNPGGFDYEGWLYQKNISATGYVRISEQHKQHARLVNPGSAGYEIVQLRQLLYDALLRSSAPTEFRGILSALTIGERKGISQEQWQVFRVTGTSHLMAISGLHIGLLAGMVFFMVKVIWPYLGNAALYMAASRAAALAALIIALFYAMLSGFAIPAQRALIMLTVVMLAIFFQQKIQSSKILVLALFAVLLFDPVSVLAPGFWLSFSAVAVIGLAAGGRLVFDKGWITWGRLQWRISLALIPLLIFLFQQASIISPVTNLLAIPVVSFLVVPIAMLGTVVGMLLPGLAEQFYLISESVMSLLWWVLVKLAHTPVSFIYGVKPSVSMLLLACLGSILLLTPRFWPFKYLGILLLLPLLFPSTSVPRHGEANFTLLDVGQGLAAVVQTTSHTLVFDTGPRFSQEFDTGAAVVAPYLRQNNIYQIDSLIVSHQDNDHRGGLESLMDSFPVKQLLTSFSMPSAKPCYAGQHWQWDGVDFEILNPLAELEYRKRNNASCVLRVEAGNQSILISGDIERKAERQLIDMYGDELYSTVLISPHHGSKTSSSEEFLAAVKPDWVLIPVGYKNRYRMPHQTVLQRYSEKNIQELKTYQTGAILFRIGQKNSTLIPLNYREIAEKYWNSRH